MFTAMVLIASLAATPLSDQGHRALEVHEQLETSGLVAASLRLSPLAGRLEIREGAADGTWLPANSKVGERWVSRHQFRLDYDPATAQLLLHAWSAQGQTLSLERPVQGALAAAAPNLLRIEVANFDANASVRLEGMELRQGDRAMPVRDFGRGTMTSDLATVWEPSLAWGFVLTGTIRVEGAVRPESAPVWIDFGLGTARRVEVAIEGHGWLRSEPPGLSSPPGDKRAVGMFAPGVPVQLEAVEDPGLRLPFRGWNDGAADAPVLALPPGTGTLAVSARFDTAASIEQVVAAAAPANTPSGGPYTFNNATPITIPAGAPGTTLGPAGPYPSTIVVDGPIGGAITDVDVNLFGLTHTYAADLDILVVSPGGDTVLLMSDACGSHSMNFTTLRFSDQFLSFLPESSSGFCSTGELWKPTNYGDGDTFAAPAPAGPYGAMLAQFNGENPNGTWRLYVVDDANGDVGALNNGWQLIITTAPANILIPATGTSGVAEPYPSIREVSPTQWLFGVILDVNVVLSGVTHQAGDDLDILVAAPYGAAAILMSDACGFVPFVGYIWRFDDEAPTHMSDNTIDGCYSTHIRPTDYEPGDVWPAPAPVGPFQASLAVLDGEVAIGSWGLFIRDDAPSDVGYLETDWYLELTLDGIFWDNFQL